MQWHTQRSLLAQRRPVQPVPSPTHTVVERRATCHMPHAILRHTTITAHRNQVTCPTRVLLNPHPPRVLRPAPYPTTQPTQPGPTPSTLTHTHLGEAGPVRRVLRPAPGDEVPQLARPPGGHGVAEAAAAPHHVRHHAALRRLLHARRTGRRGAAAAARHGDAGRGGASGARLLRLLVGEVVGDLAM